MSKHTPGPWDPDKASAAARVLLRALETLLPYLEGKEVSQPGERWAAVCAREAIAKAKGEDR